MKKINYLFYIFIIMIIFGCISFEKLKNTNNLTESKNLTKSNISINTNIIDYKISCNITDISGRGNNDSINDYGDIIKYDFIIYNTGTVTLTNISVYDEWHGLNPSLDAKNDQYKLKSGKKWVYHGEKIITKDEFIKFNETNNILTDNIKVKINNTYLQTTKLNITIDKYHINSNPIITTHDLWLIGDGITGTSVYTVGGDGHTIQILHNSTAKDPSYIELKSFVSRDGTNIHKYIENEYICTDYAENLQHNAERYGFDCAYVTITFTDNSGHACNAFNTIDKGLIFVDSTCNDYVGKLEIGSNYRSMGIVRSYGIHWD